jgi:hypothetical protein
MNSRMLYRRKARSACSAALQDSPLVSSENIYFNSVTNTIFLKIVEHQCNGTRLAILGNEYRRSARFGNPARHSTFTDETLNLTLRNTAAAAHRNNMAQRIFLFFNLQGAMGLSRYIFGSGSS